MRLRGTPALLTNDAIFVKCDTCGVHLYAPKVFTKALLGKCPSCGSLAWSTAQVPNATFDND